MPGPLIYFPPATRSNYAILTDLKPRTRGDALASDAAPSVLGAHQVPGGDAPSALRADAGGWTYRFTKRSSHPPQLNPSPLYPGLCSCFLRVESSLPLCGAHLDTLSWGLGDVSLFLRK